MIFTLVDASYFYFFRYFATLRWISFRYPKMYTEKGKQDYDWSGDEIFVQKFCQRYKEEIDKLVARSHVVIMCQDDKHSEVWRTIFYPSYKAQYENYPTRNMGDIMHQLQKEIAPKTHFIKIKQLEADDIIAISVKYVKKNYPSATINLVSGDHDFYQLAYPNLYFIDYKQKKPFQISEEEGEKVMIKKIRKGDPSDNIPSIFYKLGTKNESDPKVMYNLARNTILVDFNNIPEIYYPQVSYQLEDIIHRTLQSKNS